MLCFMTLEGSLVSLHYRGGSCAICTGPASNINYKIVR